MEIMPNRQTFNYIVLCYCSHGPHNVIILAELFPFMPSLAPPLFDPLVIWGKIERKRLPSNFAKKYQRTRHQITHFIVRYPGTFVLAVVTATIIRQWNISSNRRILSQRDELSRDPTTSPLCSSSSFTFFDPSTTGRDEMNRRDRETIDQTRPVQLFLSSHLPCSRWRFVNQSSRLSAIFYSSLPS